MKKIKLDKKKHKKLIAEFISVNKKRILAKEAKDILDLRLTEYREANAALWTYSYKKIKGLSPKKVWMFNHLDFQFEEIDLKKEMKK